MKSVTELMADVGDLRSNPAAVQRVVLNALESMTAGDYDVVDPTNPFVFLLESSCVVGAAAMQRNEALMRYQYASLAQNEQELYRHMSDVDYANRFASPARTELTLMLSMPEILDRAIEDEGGVRKMVIPRDTEITVESLTFTLQYPIEIRVMPHGGVQVVYDVSKPSPLQTLETNLLDWSLVRMPGTAGDLGHIQLLTIKIPILQLKLTDHYDQLNPSSGFSKTYSFTNQFYYARVYISSGENGEWEEIRTTHSDQVYDPTVPTAKLRVYDQQLDVSVPQIYFSRGLLSRGIRVDIYTTQGAVEMSLERYEPRSYQARWRDLSKNESKFVPPIRSFATMTLFSTERVRGGSNKLSFEELRSRVINNALGEIQVPITPAQLEAQMSNLGYDIVKDVDNITNRVYLASRALPVPNNANLSTAIGCTVGLLQESLSNLVPLTGVYDNGQRITLDSGMMFKMVNGVLSPLSNNERQALLDASGEAKAQMLAEQQYVFTPFHYVLDATENQFACRPYWLNEPEVYTKQFVAENQTARLEIGTMRYGIDKTASGYTLVIITRSGDAIKSLSDDQVHAQLSFVPRGEVDRAYLNGTLVGRTEDDEFLFEFKLDTNFDVDDQHLLQMTGFKMYDLESRSTGIELDTTLDLQYIVSDYDIDGLEASDLDDEKGQFLLPATTYVVIQESLKVRFGTALTGLWSRSRSVASSLEYVRYQDDIPAVYETTVYKRDPETGAIDLSRDPETGEVVYQILHNAGDPVLDGDGQVVYKHRKGDVKLDNEGQPISQGGRRMLRQMDLLLFEGPFALASDESILEYTQETARTIVDWVSEDIASIQNRLLENTRLWYYPQVTLGSVRAIVEDGVSTAIAADQSFRVKFYLTRIGYDNVDLRSDLSATAVEVINETLTRETVSVSDMARWIKDRVGDDVLDVVVSGLGGSENYEMLSLEDDSTRLGIRKRLEVLANGTLTVQDDVTVEFIRHRN